MKKGKIMLVWEDRAIYKFGQLGAGVLSDSELVAMLAGVDGSDVGIGRCRTLLSSLGGDLSRVAGMSVEGLMGHGFTHRQVVLLKGALELGRRRMMGMGVRGKKIKSSKDISEYFMAMLGDLDHEQFWVLYLNRSNFLIKEKMISQGGVMGTVVDAKIIFKLGVELLSSGVILCHNHPSGNVTPSDADESLTKLLKEGGKLLGIQVLDHVIVSGTGSYSFADEGKM